MKPLVTPNRVIAAVQLEDIRLRAGSFNRRVSSPAEAGRVIVEISHSARAEPLSERNAFQVVFTGNAALRPAESSSKEPALEAQVVRIQSAGPLVRLELRTGDGQELAAEISQERFGTMNLECGSTVYVRPRHIRVFSA